MWLTHGLGGMGLPNSAALLKSNKYSHVTYCPEFAACLCLWVNHARQKKMALY